MVWGFLSLTIVLLLTACTRIASPQGWASPVFKDNVLLATIGHRTLTAVDLNSNNSVLWQFPLKDAKNVSLVGIYGTPVISQNLVMLGDYGGVLYALDSAKGDQKWSQATGGPIVGGPASSADTVYVGSSDHCLYAFAVADGSPRWDGGPFCTGAKIWSTPAVSGGVVYLTSMDKKAYALDAATGDARWSKPFQAKAAIPSTPVIANGMVYFGALDNRFYALDQSSGEERWSFGADNWIWNLAVVTSDTVYFGTQGGKVYALDAASGGSRWAQPFQASSAIRAGAALVGSTLVVADDAGVLYGLEAGTGNQVWSQDAGVGILSDLVVDKGVVYFSTKNGDVESVDPSSGAITPVSISG